MTNEEAKEKLYMEWQKFLEDNIDYAGISEAYKIAFKALEQESCEDAISREEVDQNIYDYAESNGLSYVNLKHAILDVPPVTSKPKIGKWIQDKCSQCGSSAYYKSNFCPNCGAKMEEEE